MHFTLILYSLYIFSGAYSQNDYNDYNDYNTSSYPIDYNSSVYGISGIGDVLMPKPWIYCLVFCHFVVFVVGLCGNILVCVAVYRNPSMRTVTNYFILNLAVADALVILFCLPFTVVWDVTSTWWFGTAVCKFVLNLQNVSVTVSILTLTYISIDRWYAICHPLSFKSTTARAQWVICFIWVFSFIIEIPETYFRVTKPLDEENLGVIFTQCQPDWEEDTNFKYWIFKVIVFYLLPLIFISIAYTKIILILWKSNKEHSRSAAVSVSQRSGQSQENSFSMNMNTSTEGQLKSRRKAAKMLVAVVVMFALCYFPVYLFNIIKSNLEYTEANRAFSMIVHWLCYANSAMNPIIYNFMSGKFRREFKASFFHCKICNRSDRRFARNSTYIYRYTTNNRNSSKSKTEMIPLSTIKQP